MSGVVGDGSPTGAKPCPSNVPHDRHEWIDGVKRRDCPGVREPRVASSSGTGHDAEPTMRYAQIRGDQYVNVRDLCRRLREQGYPNVAAWLDESANGRVTSKQVLRVR